MLIVGAGVVGAACARAYARQGLSVAVVEPGAIGGGATAAAMGHLLVVDAADGGDEAEFHLSRRSLELWRDWLAEDREHPLLAEHERCGTLWIAADDEELELARRKRDWYAAQGMAAELLDAFDLARAEPLLRRGLTGALRVPADARVYPPKVAAAWLKAARAERITGEVVAIDGDGGVTLADGRRLWAALVVLAAGLASQRWLPAGWLAPKKGQLAITQRAGGASGAAAIHHQLVELAYIRKAHGLDADTVSFNVQPRPGGQVLIGSSRQPGQDDARLDRAMLGKMLACAQGYIPSLADMSLLRCWTGVRPASRDGQPLIGAHPTLARVWLATGHEGLGITTSLATAELVAELSLALPTTIAAAQFAPARMQP